MNKPIYATWMLSNNIGDALTPWLIRKITGQMPCFVPLDCPFPKYMVTGSILNHSVPYTIVWGAGIANNTDEISRYSDIRLVRGVMTAQRVRFQAGIDILMCGDPALILPDLYDPEVKKTHKVGIVPHYIHQKEFAEWIGDREDFKFINVFDDVETFVNNIKSCEMILSSSLHGLVIADAYRIPSKWIKGTEKVGGDGMKYMDHLILKLCLNSTNASIAMETLDAVVKNALDPQVFQRVGLCNHLYQLPKNAEKIYESFPVTTASKEALREIQNRIWRTCPFSEEAFPHIKERIAEARTEKPEAKKAEEVKKMNKVLLSILILTIPERKEKLNKLLGVLRPQLPDVISVEIIVKEELPVNQGGPIIGTNRNNALADATGEYVCFVDDDDIVPEYYVKEILSAIKTKPDVVGIKGHYILGQNKPELFIHSIEFKEWKTVDGVHQRCPNHLNPVKREIAQIVGFTEKNHGEDRDYSMALLPLLQTEVMIEPVMYFYMK